MTKKSEIDRRKFLKVGGAGLAGLTSAPRWAGTLAFGELPQRRKPDNPVVIKSEQLEVVLDRADGLPYEYRLPTLHTNMRGEDHGGQMTATICRRNPWGFVTSLIEASSVNATDSQADFQLHCSYDGQAAASAVLRYVVDGPTLHITLEHVNENSGYELIEIGMPRLVSIREEDGFAWLAQADDGGSVVALDEAKPGSLPVNPFWGKVLGTLPVVMIGTDRAVCVQHVTAFMDGTELAVSGEKGRRRASAGTIKAHRVNGSLYQSMNTAAPPGGLWVCGDESTPNLLIEQKSACRLDFIGDLDANGVVDWLDGAKLVRGRMPAMPSHYYDDKFVYSIFCDAPKFPEPAATFQQCEEHIRQVAALIDNAPQVVYLWGWQFRGKDTGYPSVAEVNQRIGGYDAMMHLMEEGRKWNCNVTLSDNYDDAYRSSPGWNPDIIARRPDGQLWESRNWTGENSYVTGMAKFMSGPGLERVRFTCDHYKLRDATHIDVLSYFAIRNDWDREHPASGIKDLIEGRYVVFDEFAKHGVNVSSEALRYPFIGKMTSYGYMQGGLGQETPFGGDQVPILPAIYRKTAIWGGQLGRDATAVDRLLNMLFFNIVGGAGIRPGGDLTEISDAYYLHMVPWFKLHDQNIESYQRLGSEVVIGLEGSSRIWMDLASKTYSVTFAGVEIARNQSTFCQIDGDRVAFYSASAGNLSAPLPEGWNPSQLGALALSSGPAEEVQPKVTGGRITVFVPGRRPVIVYRDGAKSKQNHALKPV
ncbi:MAG TPA: endo-alpha-N-acetylgalactosaminidase family protein [Terracidiphilus sp.]|nr:endo-alpha-N-acetylgalactosaminidase family protein [Terracidiphilus sp.]